MNLINQIPHLILCLTIGGSVSTALAATEKFLLSAESKQIIELPSRATPSENTQTRRPVINSQSAKPTPPNIFSPSGALTRYGTDPLIPMGNSGSIDDEKTGPRVVLKESARSYKMWYEAVPDPNASTVGYATSTDGKNWIKQGSVLSPSAYWEGGVSGEVSPNTVLVEGGVYKMWYHSFGSDGRRRIGYATSPDGITWAKNPNPVLNVGAAGSYDDYMVVEPRVFKLENGTYRMYYGAMRESEQGIGVYRLMTATSNNGINWTKQNQIIFGQVDSGFGIVKDGAQWHMWYGLSNTGLAYASSTDGLSWTQGPSNPVLSLNNNPAASDSEGVGDSVSAYKDGNEFRIMYTGGRYNSFGRNESITLATITVEPQTTTTHTFFDYDGDGKADISVFRPSSGAWYLLSSSDNQFAAALFGQNGDKPVPADYDGDGITDFATFRLSTETWYLQQSTAGFKAAQFGLTTDIPAPGDYDGDGKSDIAVFRPANGTWYLQRSSDGSASIRFGSAGDVPVTGDYDGDGKADIAVYRPSNNFWYRLNSSNNQSVAIQFGANGDLPNAADFDGDGKTDLAVFRRASGTWYLFQSTDGFANVAFGSNEDRPAAADYDGDGKANIAVFRPSTGSWYIKRTGASFYGTQFGFGSDVPTESAFVPIN